MDKPISNSEPGFLKAMADIEKDEPWPELQQLIESEITDWRKQVMDPTYGSKL